MTDALPRFSVKVSGFVLFEAVALYLIFTHSPWFDEEHALPIARDPWSNLLHNLKYEGHPALWYFWLGAVDRVLSGSPWSLPAALAPIAVGLHWLIWLRSPFPVAAKALLSLSYFVIFEYGAISRSYALGALLLLASVPLRRGLLGWILLALAANTSVHDAVGAVALGLAFFLERPGWRGPLILVMGGVTAALTVFPVAPDLNPTASTLHASIVVKIMYALRAEGVALAQNLPSWPYRWLNYLPIGVGAIVGLLVLPLGCWSLRKKPATALAFALTYLGLFVIAVKTYELSPRHVGTLFMVLVGGWWMITETQKLSRIAWGWLAVAAICGLPFVLTANMVPFTHHREIAAWIKAHGLAGETWGAWPGREGTTITAHLGPPTVNLERNCLNTFVRWDYPHDAVTNPGAHVAATGVRYAISEAPIPGGVSLVRFGVGGGWERPVTLYRFDNMPRLLTTCS